MSDLTYEALVAELFPRLTGGIRWGLDRTLRMLAEVGDPHHAYRVVHVGGTNGKGSVAAHVESVLRSDGCAVGLYTSPHLCTFRERIRIGGRAIEEGALLAAARRLWPTVRRESPSFFEATTAIAFLALAEAGIEVAVVEVGLGGRLDSTNVVKPDVVALTNVSLDHVPLLGLNIEEIAREKAGIIKSGAVVVTAEVEGAALDVFRGAAAAAGTRVDAVAAADIESVSATLDGTKFSVRGSAWGDVLALRTPLVGAHQAVNAALAVRTLSWLPRQPSEDAVRRGIADVAWPGRLQVERRGRATWLFDVAHNVAGVDALVAAVRELPVARPLTAVVGVLGDKDWKGMLGPVCELADEVLLTAPPTAPGDRRWDPGAVQQQLGRSNTVAEPDFLAALHKAGSAAGSAGGTVLVTGSFHTVGDALAVLGWCRDGRDAHMPTSSGSIAGLRSP